MKKIILLLFISLSWSLEAQEILPNGCKPFVIDKTSLIVPKGKTHLLALHNLTETDLWIIALTPNTSADLTGHLEANAWSLLKTNGKRLTFNCIESKPGHEQQVSCQSTLSICEWPILSEQRKKEVFWIAENTSLSSLIAYATRKGWMSAPALK